MKKYLLFFVFFAVALLLLTFSACNTINQAYAPDADSLAKECVRIHIRANSNAPEDQSVKLKVRDAITDYLTVALADCTSKSEALAVLESECAKLNDIAQSTLYDNSFTYSSTANVEIASFPNRTYDDYVFPAGEYDALIIRLGSGTGDNWWCVAFPPLCFVPEGDGEQVVYKSFVKELLDKIFN